MPSRLALLARRAATASAINNAAGAAPRFVSRPAVASSSRAFSSLLARGSARSALAVGRPWGPPLQQMPVRFFSANVHGGYNEGRKTSTPTNTVSGKDRENGGTCLWSELCLLRER
jgi:hypothetical protein